MFESAELGNRVTKAEYAQREPELRQALLEAQFELKQSARCAVLIVVAGPHGAGRSELVNVLKEWMDPRHLLVAAFGDATDEERSRPPSWRYWRALPPKGQIGIHFNAWYAEAFSRRIIGHASAAEFQRTMHRIEQQEGMLAAEGMLILKFWVHLSRKDFDARNKALARHPETRWRVTREDRETFERYKKLKKVAGEGLAATSKAHAPWIVVEGVDERYRNLCVGQALLDALRARLAQPEPRPAPAPESVAAIEAKAGVNLLDRLDLDKSLDGEDYDKQLALLQARLNKLTRSAAFRKIALLAAFEGNDAAGKGGAIRRLTSALDARAYDVHPIAAPSDEERARPYLWRFWRQVPRLGRIAIFDRSWYGRVLVERVEGFCSVADWTRAYAEIRAFERDLVDSGIVLVKFWLAIGKDEQHRRFKQREQLAHKRHKITAEDWRNREKWDAYAQAVCDMVDRTSTAAAPWTLVEANDKRHARIKVMQTLCDRIEAAL